MKKTQEKVCVFSSFVLFFCCFVLKSQCDFISADENNVSQWLDSDFIHCSFCNTHFLQSRKSGSVLECLFSSRLCNIIEFK